MITRSSQKTGYTDNSVRWTPREGSTTLDGITPDEHPLFRYILTRNGHNVSLYGGFAQVAKDFLDLSRRFPLDDWSVIDRLTGGILCVRKDG